MDNYLPQIVSYLENKEPPSRICAQIKLCSNLTQPVKRAAQQSACDICELVVQMAENYLQQNATEQQILAKLDSVCERLPSPYGQEVRSFLWLRLSPSTYVVVRSARGRLPR